jgi:hypothetical protein
MAIVHKTPVIRTTAAQIVIMPLGVQYTTVNIFNSGTESIFVGDSTITTTGAQKGMTIATNTSLVLNMNAGDVLWAIAAATTTVGDVVIIFSGI